MKPSLAVACLLVMAFLAACGRAPVPTSDQATFTLSPLPSTTYAFPATAVSTVASATPQDTPTPSITPTLIPSSTAIPTSTSIPTLAANMTPVAYDHNPRAILIEADMLGGTPSMPREAHVPTWRLYADGLVVAAAQQASLSTGLDALARTGHLSDAEVQYLLAYLRTAGFFDLDASYAPRPTPPNLATARITVYLTKTKSVSVYGPGYPGTPQNFIDAFTRLTQTVPSDAKPFVATDGYLLATSAGAANDLKNVGDLTEWTGAGVRLADATDGITVSGNTFTNAAALVGKAYPKTLFREGGNAYRVRFVPNLPRSVYLTDWIGPILDGTREFEGRVFDITGYFRGANLLGEARGTPKSKNDWVILDASGAMWVSGALPAGLELAARGGAWTVVRLRAAVIYVRNGTSYLEVRSVQTVGGTTAPQSAGSPTAPAVATATPAVSATVAPQTAAPTAPLQRTASPTAPIANSDAAVKTVQARYTELSKIKPAGAGTIGASTDIKVFERADGWDIAFWEGSGDCPSGCINNRYTYFSVKKDGRVDKAGEYVRLYNSTTNSFDVSGSPMWGVPKN